MDLKKWHKTVDDKKHIQKEKNKARELRKTPWWKKKLAEGLCYYCKQKFKPRELTMDHIVPVARGGKSTRGNIVASCLKCNVSKGLDTPVDMILSREEKKKG